MGRGEKAVLYVTLAALNLMPLARKWLLFAYFKRHYELAQTVVVYDAISWFGYLALVVNAGLLIYTLTDARLARLTTLVWVVVATVAQAFILAYYLIAAPTGWLWPIFGPAIVYPLAALALAFFPRSEHE